MNIMNKIGFDYFTKTTNKIVRDIMSTFANTEYSEVVSECYIELNRMAERLSLKEEFIGLIDSDELVSDFKRKLNIAYYNYASKNVYAKFKRNTSLIKMPKGVYEKYQVQEKMKDRIHIQESKETILNEVKKRSFISIYEDSIGLDDYLVDHNSVDRYDFEILIGEIKKVLTKEEFYIFYRNVIGNDNFTDIARNTNTTKQTISNKMKTIKNKLKSELKNWKDEL